jgi:hypothetical protein
MRAEATGFQDGPVDAAPRRRRPRRLSELFAQLAHDADGPVSIGHIRDALGNRSFAPLLVLFSAFNLLPLPPGASVILGLPLIIVSAQMVYGTKQAWLPGVLAGRSLNLDTFRTAMEWIIPRLVRIEQVIRPRYWPFWRKRGERFIGGAALVMAIVVTLPIPLGNWLPALATGLLGLALSERDGILLAVGVFVSVAALVIVAVVIGAAGFATNAALGWLF